MHPRGAKLAPELSQPDASSEYKYPISSRRSQSSKLKLSFSQHHNRLCPVDCNSFSTDFNHVTHSHSHSHSHPQCPALLNSSRPLAPYVLSPLFSTPPKSNHIPLQTRGEAVASFGARLECCSQSHWQRNAASSPLGGTAITGNDILE